VANSQNPHSSTEVSRIKSWVPSGGRQFATSVCVGPVCVSLNLTGSLKGQIGKWPHERRALLFRRFSQDFNNFRRNFIEHSYPMSYSAGTVNRTPRVPRLVCSSAACVAPVIVVSLFEA
jgi:hypothetical protein